MKKWFENVKISKKLSTGFLIVALLSVAVGAVGIANMINMEHNRQETYDHCTLGLKYAYKAEADFMSLGKSMSGLQINLNNADAKEQYIDKVKHDRDAVEADLNAYRGTVSSDEEQNKLEAVKSSYATYLDIINENLSAVQSGGTGESSLANMAKAASVAQDAAGAFETLAEYNASAAQKNIASSKASATLAMAVMAAVAAAAFVIALLLSRFISGMISEPMRKFAAFTELLAVGDIDVSKVVEEKDRLWAFRKDEVGILAGSFEKMISGTAEQAQKAQAIADGDLTTCITVRSENDVLGKALTELVKKFHRLAVSLVTSAEQVDSGAKQVADSSTALSQGATEQASSVEELSASMQEITAQTEQNAQNAEKTNELAQNIQKDADTGNAQMAEMLRAMEEINASSVNISKIIKVIEDIAFQTNILALNAAIEAARAGTAGKGFSVVAEEVRNLAAKSAEAAKETTALIETSIKKVGTGTGIAQETAGALVKIVNGISQAGEIIGSIATASHAQAAALEQVNQGVMQISQVVQNNAASAEESAAASEELSAEADGLKDQVSVFKLNTDSQPLAAEPLSKQTAPSGEQKQEKSGAAQTAAKPEMPLSVSGSGKY